MSPNDILKRNGLQTWEANWKWRSKEFLIETLIWKQDYQQNQGQEGLFPCPGAMSVLLWRMDGHGKRTGGSAQWTKTQTSWAKLITYRPWDATSGTPGWPCPSTELLRDTLLLCLWDHLHTVYGIFDMLHNMQNRYSLIIEYITYSYIF